MANLSDKVRLLRGLVSGRMAFTGPFYVVVDVTRRCNLRCPGCRFHSALLEPMPSVGDQEVRDLPLELFRRLCADLQTMGTESLVLIGEGEPLLVGHVFELVAIAKEAGLYVTLFTNGTLLDETRIQAMVESGLDLLTVSLWGSSQQEYERNYPGCDPGNFERIVTGMQLLSEAKAAQHKKLPEVALYQPISHDNYQNIEAMIDLAQKTGCGMLSFVPFKNRRGQLTQLALTAYEEKQVCRALTEMAPQLDSLGIRHNVDSTLLRYRIGEKVWEKVPCYIGWHHVRIKVDGTVQPCNPCDLSMGNLNEQSLPEIWNGLALQSFRQRSITRRGLSELAEQCDCGFCCHLENNWQVHRMLRWVAPVIARSGNWRNDRPQ